MTVEEKIKRMRCQLETSKNFKKDALVLLTVLCDEIIFLNEKIHNLQKSSPVHDDRYDKRVF